MLEMCKKVVFENYFNFSGRARRKEWFLFVFLHLIMTFIFYKVNTIIEFAYGIEMTYNLVILYSLLVFIPLIAVTVRRLHDVDKSGWYILVPFYNLVLVWSKGEEGLNNYGEDPIDEVEYLRELGKDLN